MMAKSGDAPTINAGYPLSGPGDDPHSFKSLRQGQQRGEIDQSVPAARLPITSSQSRTRVRTMSAITARMTVVGLIHSPAKSQSENATRIEEPHHDFFAREWSHPASSSFAQAETSGLDSDFGRINQVNEQRQGQDEHETDRQEAGRPLRPGDVDSSRLADDAQREQIRPQGRQEHRARDGGRGESSPHQVSADPPGGRPGAEP